MKHTFFYNPAGRLTHIDGDRKVDDSVDTKVIFKYDAEGNIVSAGLSRGNDGKIDMRMNYSYECWK